MTYAEHPHTTGIFIDEAPPAAPGTWDWAPAPHTLTRDDVQQTRADQYHYPVIQDAVRDILYAFIQGRPYMRPGDFVRVAYSYDAGFTNAPPTVLTPYGTLTGRPDPTRLGGVIYEMRVPLTEALLAAFRPAVVHRPPTIKTKPIPKEPNGTATCYPKSVQFARVPCGPVEPPRSNPEHSEVNQA